MPIYLITIEDIDDGMWFGEPIGYPSEDLARRAVAGSPPPPPGYSRVLYRCDEIETLATTR